MTWEDIEQAPESNPIEQLADALAASIAKGSADYGARRNELKRLLVEWAREVRREVRMIERQP